MTTRRTSVVISAVVFIMTLSTLAAQQPNDGQLLRVRETVWRAWFAGDTKTVEDLVPPRPSSSAAARKSGKGKPMFFEHPQSFMPREENSYAWNFHARKFSTFPTSRLFGAATS